MFRPSSPKGLFPNCFENDAICLLLCSNPFANNMIHTLQLSKFTNKY